MQIAREEEGFAGLWTGVVPRVAKAVLSGAVQFGSYEFTRGSLARLFIERNYQKQIRPK